MLITAEQARQRAKAAISNYEYFQFNEIMENIDKRSAQGYYNYYGDGALRPVVRKKLEELGYDIATGYQYNQPWVIIRW